MTGPAGGARLTRMSTSASKFLDHDDTPTEDHFVRLHGVSWRDYERLLAMRGDHSAPRIAYLEGEVEIMSPSRTHERVKSLIGRLVETWCLVKGVEFSPFGSWTQKDKAVARGVEPDECYVFGTEPAERPHLAIEVIWTSGGLDKLEIYRLLDIPEIWIWRKGRIQVHVLAKAPASAPGDARYVPSARSEALPSLDLAQLASFLDRPTASQAIREYRQALGAP